jgi:NADH pyrophosphatase NudC (nudix superfamily)
VSEERVWVCKCGVQAKEGSAWTNAMKYCGYCGEPRPPEKKTRRPLAAALAH